MYDEDVYYNTVFLLQRKNMTDFDRFKLMRAKQAVRFSVLLCSNVAFDVGCLHVYFHSSTEEQNSKVGAR